MAARTGMAYIITMVREEIWDTSSEWWTDDQIQQRLDRYRRRILREPLKYDVDQKIYQSAYEMFEGVAYGGTWGSGIAIYNDPGADATAYTPDSWNLVDGYFAWTTDQDETYYLDAWSYGRAFHKVCAGLLRAMAADPNRFTSTGRGGLYMSNYNLLQLASIHESKAGASFAEVVKVYP
jgi:hypothetical protein